MQPRVRNYFIEKQRRLSERNTGMEKHSDKIHPVLRGAVGHPNEK
jgi:hypothetical protein